jgi:hypothetical protein
MSPLLVWALRFTGDFAPDILAALAEQQRPRSRIAPRHSTDAASRLAGLLHHTRAVPQRDPQRTLLQSDGSFRVQAAAQRSGALLAG